MVGVQEIETSNSSRVNAENAGFGDWEAWVQSGPTQDSQGDLEQPLPLLPPGKHSWLC